MKRLIMCEGPNELEVMRSLLKYDALIFSEDDLLGLTPYHARQLKNSVVVRAALNIYPGNDVLVMRIGDKQSDKLIVPSEYADKIYGIQKYCTKPELEILLIIAEGLSDDYDKVKSKVSPKNFAKQYIRCGRMRYDNSSLFYRDYIETDVTRFLSAIREYKRTHSHQKDELYLADILKEK